MLTIDIKDDETLVASLSGTAEDSHVLIGRSEDNKWFVDIHINSLQQAKNYEKIFHTVVRKMEEDA